MVVVVLGSQQLFPTPRGAPQFTARRERNWRTAPSGPQVKTVFVVGHYNCGAVKAALQLPSRTPGLVSCGPCPVYMLGPCSGSRVQPPLPLPWPKQPPPAFPPPAARQVNCWISDIREARNQAARELAALDSQERIDRLCELNVLRQVSRCTLWGGQKQPDRPAWVLHGSLPADPPLHHVKPAGLTASTRHTPLSGVPRVHQPRGAGRLGRRLGAVCLG